MGCDTTRSADRKVDARVKYKEYADDIARLIYGGELAPGQRLPSVRELGAQRGLSPVTVLKAYHRLEARGLIVARPRSGFFVAQRVPAPLPQPQPSRPVARATPVHKGDFIHDILYASKTPEVIPLGSAFPSPTLFPMARLARSMNRVMKRLDPWRAVTDLTPGSARLRQQLALRYQISGIALDAQELIVTDGALEGLNLCLQAVTRPGDSVVIESPTFYAALQTIQRLGLRALEVATDPAGGVDLQALENVLQRQQPAACWLMTNFQNPTGACMSDANKQALVRLLAAHKVPLIEDDVYGEIYFDGHRPRPAKAFDREGGVLHCSSFSKCLAPGYRVGWAAAGRYADVVQQLKLGTTLSTALPPQVALEDYLDEADYDRHLKTFRAALQDGRDALLEAVRDFFPEGTRVTVPQGGYFAWLELPRTVDTLVLHQRALAHNISVAPGAIFCAREDFSHALRLNYGHPEDRRINRALKWLGQQAAELAGTQAA